MYLCLQLPWKRDKKKERRKRRKERLSLAYLLFLCSHHHEMMLLFFSLCHQHNMYHHQHQERAESNNTFQGQLHLSRFHGHFSRGTNFSSFSCEESRRREEHVCSSRLFLWKQLFLSILQPSSLSSPSFFLLLFLPLDR